MIVSGSQLPKIRKEYANEHIVLGTGCFDILHVGHRHYLEEAKKLGDIVVVSLLGNRKAHEIKGTPRPINSAENRASMIDEFRSVDFVTVEPYRAGREARSSFFETLHKLQPDVFYGDETWLDYAEPIRQAGVELRIRDSEKLDSTTNMIGRLLQNAQVLQRPA